MSSSSSSSLSSESSWSCPSCTLFNLATKRRCDACKTRKPVVSSDSQQEQQQELEHEQEHEQAIETKTSVSATATVSTSTARTRTRRSARTTSPNNGDLQSHIAHDDNDNDNDDHRITTAALAAAATAANKSPASTSTPSSHSNPTYTIQCNLETKSPLERPPLTSICPPSPPRIVYHHVIAGWHDTHTKTNTNTPNTNTTTRTGEVQYCEEYKGDNDNSNNDSNDGKIYPVVNPATNKPSLYYQETSEEALEHAIQQATAIQQRFYCGSGGDVTEEPSSSSSSIIDTAAWWSDPHQYHRRADVLTKIADLLSKATDRLADLEVLQIGRPRKEMRFQLSRLPEWFVYYASLLRVSGSGLGGDAAPPFGGGGEHVNIVQRVPLGVVAQITPFNHPLLIAVKKLGPALAAGNCVIIKPSEQAPASIVELALLCREAGVPDGVLSVVLGSGPRGVGERLVSDPRIRKVDFTGGPTAGYAIGAAAGRNVCKMTQELGGKAPMIVFAPKQLVRKRQKRLSLSDEKEKKDDDNDNDNDNDIDEYLDPIVNGCAFGAFIASGQTCIAGTRLLVQRDIYEMVCKKLVHKIKNTFDFKMGDPSEMTTTFGPMINKKQMEFVHSTVTTSCSRVDNNSNSSNNLELLCGGKRYRGFTGNESYLNEGNWYEPTLVAFKQPSYDDKDNEDSRKKIITDLHHNSALFQSELFGPVLGILPFEDEDHAIRLANDSPFSLGCSIWTHDLVQAHSVANKIRAGIIWINDHHKNAPASPWGGLTKESGVGRENGREALMEYSQAKSIVIRTKPFTADWFRDPNARYN